MNVEDKLKGLRFGKLVVLGDYEPSRRAINLPDNYAARVYASVLCECDCGRTKRVSVNNLRKGSTKSCGCFRLETSSENGKLSGRMNGLKRRKHPTIESSARDLFQKYMRRNPGNLDFDKFYQLTQQACYYCGELPNQKYLVRNATDNLGTYTYNGLDRLDNSKGYDLENVITCCGICNFMRNKLTMEDFFAHVAKIAHTHLSKLCQYGLEIDPC
jgi:hypothetical protein